MTRGRANLKVFLACVVLVLVAQSAAAAEDEYVKSADTFLHDALGQQIAALVVGFVDEHGSKVIACGKLDNGTANEVDGDTVFFIGSVSKTFTALLLVDAVERGEMKLDDPVAKYLPKSVTMPTHNGKEITLLDLATHTAGLPCDPDNMVGADARQQYESYTVEMMYSFLSRFTLSRDPGTEVEYSNVGMSLLGHVIALNAKADYESLVVDRICRPLHMDSTCITLTPALKARLAVGHEKSGAPSLPWALQAYSPAGNIHSTANDLLKYAAAHAGLTNSKLTPAIEKTHVIRHLDSRGFADTTGFGTLGRIAMDWHDRGTLQPPGMELLAHAGGAGSYHAWVGFDLKQHRGVVVLSTSNELTVEAIGWTLLQRMPLTPESTKMFVRELVGIGTALALDPQARGIRITKVFPNSPAAQAGITSEMVIQKIDDTSAQDKSLADCMKLLRGGVGSKVRLELLDPAGKKTTVELTRQRFMTANG